MGQSNKLISNKEFEQFLNTQQAWQLAKQAFAANGLILKDKN